MGKSPSILGKGGAADPQPFPAPYRKATDMDDTAVKNALDASPAPRVTEDKLAAAIIGETFAHRLTGTLTICVLTLVNGFTVVGQSACASPENYREDLGEHYAREDAKRKVWPLEAYLLKQRMYEEEAADRPETSFLDRMRTEHAELNDKLTKLGAFLDSVAFEKLDNHAAELLVQQHGIMGLYTNILGQRIALAEAA